MSESPSLKDRRQQILVEDPLYTSYDVPSASDDDAVAKFAFAKGHLDAFCPECGTQTVYLIDPGHSFDTKAKGLPTWGVFSVEAKCTRHESDLFGEKGRFYATFYRNYNRDDQDRPVSFSGRP